MNVLAIETATPMCSVALAVGGEARSYRELAPRGHASLLLPWIEGLLAEAGIGYAGLDRLAVGRGPGGFTSLRIGLGVAQGIGLAHDLPIAPVSSLAALAHAAGPESEGDRVLALIDARMGEVFAGWFGRSAAGLRELAPEAVLAPGDVSVPGPGPWRVAGSGLAAYDELIRRRIGDEAMTWQPDAWPLAESLLALADDVEPVPAWRVEPKYVRDRVTQG
ncbi:tRNA (adenosine(37)-N6)-threonylcarbamoyltransferase complex dimerization subunit type 1 TsaB [Wenzhouxiangella limi]|uniref:tRNA threonylcarbamoyladenosine biosynthesis protein TsaB n=1 Tax=Wenzhouxiangella limi TaxID=2707351 RepID=A0A845VFV1_9GAMM|nr:tRNA (adenosine(37)-N6)-threonylcarbamoyltransferase complex dimerization subunit type 1 TsaB [Wenzhouxiangella limi]